MSIDTVDGLARKHEFTSSKQAEKPVKILTEKSGLHKIVQDKNAEVCKIRTGDVDTKRNSLKSSKSCVDIAKSEKNIPISSSKSNTDLQDRKNCDENLIKFIFTKHGIQVISDVETIV